MDAWWSLLVLYMWPLISLPSSMTIGDQATASTVWWVQSLLFASGISRVEKHVEEAAGCHIWPGWAGPRFLGSKSWAASYCFINFNKQLDSLDMSITLFFAVLHYCLSRFCGAAYYLDGSWLSYFKKMIYPFRNTQGSNSEALKTETGDIGEAYQFMMGSFFSFWLLLLSEVLRTSGSRTMHKMLRESWHQTNLPYQLHFC